MMMTWIKLYVFMVPVFFAIDMVWLMLVAQKIYQKALGSLMAPSFNWIAILAFYFLYIGGIILFAVQPALSKGSLPSVVFLGAAFGFLAYATYDLTNLGTLRDWPISITMIDLAWGTTLTALVATAGYFIAMWLGLKG